MEKRPKKKLLNQVRDVIRLKHYSIRTEKACMKIFSCKKFIIITFLLLVIPMTGSSYQIVFMQEPIESRQIKKESKWAFSKESTPGSRIVALSSDGEISVLTPEFASAFDPAVSCDAKRILFAGKLTPKARCNIWEMDIDGKNKKQITKDLGDCREPEYMALGSITPPEFTDKVRWIVFTSNAANTYDEHGSVSVANEELRPKRNEGLATSLYVTNLEPIEGRDTLVWRTTFNLSSDFSPTVLRDGRVLFSSWQHHGTRYYPNGMVALLTMNWAGTGLNLLYGNHQGATLKTMACEMPNRTVVFVESDGSTRDGSGNLARISFKRPLRSHEVLSKGEGQYRTPHAFPNGELVVSYTSSGQNNYGIYLFDFEQGKPGKKIYDAPDWHDVDAIAIAPRPEPMGRITIVVDAKGTGHLQCLNVYDSDSPEASDIKSGEVKSVRFVEGVPNSVSEREKLPLIGTGIGLSGPGSTPIGATPFARARILGEAPVEPDGSFYVEVAADTPFFIQTLDENSMALQTMRGWMWVRRGSRRGCIGCHENKELAPENRVTQALIKAQPQSLTAPPEKRRTVDFLHNVMPIIKRRCISCHGGNSPAGKFHLNEKPTKYFNTTYQGLLMPKAGKTPEDGGKYVHPGNARKSLLVHLLYGWKDKVMPPNNPLPDAERKTFVEWIDIGAQWDNRMIDGE